MGIGAVIVNYRTTEATLAAVNALVPEMLALGDEPSIVVVDNDSKDGSLERLQEARARAPWASLVTVMNSAHNGGYGYGINVGVRDLLSRPGRLRYVYVINPDAAPDPNSVKRLVTFMDEHPDTGLAGSLVHGTNGETQAVAFRFPSLLGELEGAARIGLLSRVLDNHKGSLAPADSCDVDWVSGTSMLIRPEVFSTAGLFDEGFFLYFEEIDFAKRVRQAGWKVSFVTDAGITHIGSLSTGMADETRPMPRYWFESRRRYLVKHHGSLYGAAADAVWLLGHALYATKTKLLGRPYNFRPGFWQDFARYSLANVAKPAPIAEQNRSVVGSP